MTIACSIPIPICLKTLCAGFFFKWMKINSIEAPKQTFFESVMYFVSYYCFCKTADKYMNAM